MDDATGLFWQKGFNGASLSELVAVTGLNKHSMYKEFGSKAGLFEECLTHYFAKVGKEQLRILEQTPLGLDNIKRFFKNRIRQIYSEDFTCCLIVKTAVEKELIHKNALNKIQVQNKIFQDAIRQCILAGQKDNAIPETADPDLLTAYLVHFLSGMMVAPPCPGGRQQADHLLELVMSTFSA